MAHNKQDNDIPHGGTSEQAEDAGPVERGSRKGEVSDGSRESRTVEPAEEGENTRGLQQGSWDYTEGSTVAEPRPGTVYGEGGDHVRTGDSE